MSMENFEIAFDSRIGSCSRQCECGRQFYNPDPSWDFEDGELEQLQNNKNATALNCSVSIISFEDKEYVDSCDCWQKRAKQIMSFIDGHAYQIAEYLTLEKKRKEYEAKISPIVE